MQIFWMRNSLIGFFIFFMGLEASLGQSYQYDHQTENCLDRESQLSGYNPRAPTECTFARHPKWYSKDMTNFKLTGSQVEFGDLRFAKMNGAKIDACHFQQTFFSGANLLSAKLNKSSFVGSYFENANLGLVFAESADFSGIKASGIRFDGANLEKAKFIGADLWGASFVGANLSGADFTNAVVLMGTFRGALFDDKTILPFSVAEALKKGMKHR